MEHNEKTPTEGKLVRVSKSPTFVGAGWKQFIEIGLYIEAIIQVTKPKSPFPMRASLWCVVIMEDVYRD